MPLKQRLIRVLWKKGRLLREIAQHKKSADAKSRAADFGVRAQ
jgi:hypothetical protein